MIKLIILIEYSVLTRKSAIGSEGLITTAKFSIQLSLRNGKDWWNIVLHPHVCSDLGGNLFVLAILGGREGVVAA